MALKLKFDSKKLIESGEVIESLTRANLKVDTVASTNQHFLKTNTGLLEIKQVRNKIMINNTELSAFLKKNNFLNRYLEANKEIFNDDSTDSFEKIMEYVESYKDDVLVVGESIYIYNGIYYELLDFNSLENECYKLIREVTIPEEKLVDKAVYFVYKEFVINGRSYEMRRDYSYKDRVSLAFNDGTLYITKEKLEFVEAFNPSDNLFFKFDLNYLELKESNGIVEKWFNVRFYTPEERSVAVASIGDLFVTNCFSQAMLYLYGAGGTGKSLLQESFSSLLCKGATSTVNINDVGNQFKTAPLFKSVINFSSEISRKAVSADRFKSIIARDEETLSLKFKNDCKSRPLAKWLSVANSLPTIEIDSGVKRRLLAIEVTSDLIYEHNDIEITKSDFEQLFFNDKSGMINIILEGIMNLLNFGFDLKTLYDSMVGNRYIETITNLNDSISHFMSYATEKKSDLGEEKGILKTDLFLAFEEFRKLPEGTGIASMKSQTFYARIKELLYKDKRAKYKTEEGEWKNSKAYYPSLCFKEDFSKEISQSKTFSLYNIDDLRVSSNIETSEKLEKVKESERSVLSGK